MKSNILCAVLFFLLLSMLAGCSSDTKLEKAMAVQPDTAGQPMITRGAGSSERPALPPVEDRLPYPWFVHNIFRAFTNIGMHSYYALNKHVPLSFEDYINSGIPLLIPKDYVSGKTYHLVDSIDINDTSGFTFTSDGIDTCTFEFVIKNNKTNSNQIHPFRFDSSDFLDFKSGMFSTTSYYFDQVKREHCVFFFTIYGYIYLDKHDGKAPESLVEMLKDEGEPIEAGWKWSPEPGSNEYFEYGIDASKLRSYHIQIGPKTPSGEMAIAIQQMHKGVRTGYKLVEGVDIWGFRSKDSVPPDVIELNKFISSDTFYEGYRQIKG